MKNEDYAFWAFDYFLYKKKFNYEGIDDNINWKFESHI